MAGAVNIRFGLIPTDYVNGIKTVQAATSQFTTAARQQFEGLKGSAEAPAGAFSSLSRQLNVVKREISDVLSVGGNVSAELAAKYSVLQNALDAVRGTFSKPVAVTAFVELNTKLSETKARIQDILAVGGQVPDVLRAEFKDLESQVARVNSEFDRVPTKAERLAGIGSTLQSVGRGLSVLTATIALVGVTSFKSYADINALQLGLQNITGSAEGATRRFNELLPVVRLPGLGLEEAVKGDVRLQAVGFSANQAKQALLQFGNAIALTGGGKFELDSVLTQLTQMGSKAKVLAEDLKPILTASPAVAKAIREMFGTVDSEQISAKLQAAGRSPIDFINDLTAKLAQLERVQGGPKNAIENFGDSLKLAGFEVGKAADEILNLTGIINGLGDLVGSAAEGFGKLSPGLKATILGIVGVTAAIGPLSYGIGTLIVAGPALAKAMDVAKIGISALLNPTTLAVVGLAALGVAIYNANKPVVDLVEKTQLLAEVNGAASRSIATEQAALDRLYQTATNEQLSKKQRLAAIQELNRISPEYLGFLNLENINSSQAADAIYKQAQAIQFRAKARAAEDKLVELYRKRDEVAAKDVKEFEKPFINSIKTNPLTGLTMPVAISKVEVQELAQQEKNRALSSIDENISDLTREAEKNQRRAGRRGIVVDLPKLEITDYSKNTGKSAIQDLKDQVKTAREAVDSFKVNNPGKAVPAELLNNFQSLTDKLKAATAETKNYGKTAKAVKEVPFGDVESLKRLEKYLEGVIQLAGGKGVDLQIQQLKSVREQIEKLDAITSKEQKLNITGIQEIATPATFGRVQGIVDSFRQMATLAPGIFDKAPVTRYLTEFQKLFPSLDYYQAKVQEIQEVVSKLSVNGFKVPKEAIDDLTKYVSAINAASRAQQDAMTIAESNAEDQRLDSLPVTADLGIFKILDDSKAKMVGVVENLKQGIKDALKSAAVTAYVGMGEVIGGLISGTKGIEDLPKLLLNTLGGLLKQLGTIAIEAAVGLKAIKLALSTLNPAVALVAGIGLVALGAAIQSGVSKIGGGATAFADGGIVSGPTLGLIGEYAGASNNPEVVAPLDKLKNYISGTGGTQVFIPDIQLDGQIIRIALNRADDNALSLS